MSVHDNVAQKNGLVLEVPLPQNRPEARRPRPAKGISQSKDVHVIIRGE